MWELYAHALRARARDETVKALNGSSVTMEAFFNGRSSAFSEAAGNVDDILERSRWLLLGDEGDF